MPGANCSIFGCSTSRKTKGVVIFKLPAGNDDFNKSWREKLVSIITKDREIDAGLRRQIDALHICELNYTEDCLIRNPNKTTRILGSLPTVNLPVKSFTAPKTERSTVSIEKRALASTSTTSHLDEESPTFIHLTSYSIMNVKLAAQVLSESMSKVLKAFGPAEAAGTANFCLMMDSFFDILNIRNTSENIHKSKPLLAPIASTDDKRLVWLIDEFLEYFKKWQQSIEKRPGDFTKAAKEKMFISRQAYKCLQITVHSVVECTKFLLQNDVCKYVLTEKFCQDPLENYFGRQRALGARKDNPTVRDVGYNDNSIRNQKVFRPIAGNVGGADKAVVEINNDPVPCRKRVKLT